MSDKSTGGKVPFAFTAAKLSWVAPLVVFGLNYLNRTSNRDSAAADPETQSLDTIVVASLSLLFILCGLGLAIFALASMKKHGRERIYKHAKAGLIANSIILVFAAVSLTLFLLL